MLILLFAVTLGWFPSGGYLAFFDSPIDNLRHTLLPSLALGTEGAAIIMRHTRSAMLQVMKQDYVSTARAATTGGSPVTHDARLRPSAGRQPKAGSAGETDSRGQ